jgi:hypothetical protein
MQLDRRTIKNGQACKHSKEVAATSQTYACANGKTVQNCSHQQGHFDRDVLAFEAESRA